MNKKSLLKKMSIVVASAAMVVTALPLTASAASYKSGDYTAYDRWKQRGQRC